MFYNDIFISTDLSPCVCASVRPGRGGTGAAIKSAGTGTAVEWRGVTRGTGVCGGSKHFSLKEEHL